jgi:hypothetical protein
MGRPAEASIEEIRPLFSITLHIVQLIMQEVN